MSDNLEILGVAILAGFVTGRLFNRFKVPAVAGYVVVGILFGDSITGIFHEKAIDRLGIVADLALGLIALNIGGQLQLRVLKRIGRSVAFIVLLESTGAMIAVTLCVQLLLHQWPLSLLLGAISAATAPAATVMVIQEMRAGGVLTSTLLAVVGIDDAIALILYGFAAAVAKALLTAEAAFSVSAIAGGAAFEIGGAILLGGLSGVLLARWLRRLESTEALFSVLIGAMLLILGIARQFGLSPLLANMALGIALANTCPMPSERIFNHVSLFAAPLLIAFFVVAGAHLRIDLLFSLGLLSLVYLLARMAGKVSGAFLGAALGGAAPEVRRYIGFGLLSQVGIAIGLSLVVAGEFAPLGEEGRHIALIVINVLLATTVVTEIVGPILTRYALVKAGEAGQAERFRP